MRTGSGARAVLREVARGQADGVRRGALQPRLDEHGLTAEHWRIIAVVSDQPGLGMGEVAASAVVPAATLTRHMDRLVERGIVVRRVDPDDARRSVVALSPRGEAYAERLRAVGRSVTVDLRGASAARHDAATQ